VVYYKLVVAQWYRYVWMTMFCDINVTSKFLVQVDAGLPKQRYTFSTDLSLFAHSHMMIRFTPSSPKCTAITHTCTPTQVSDCSY
jgi:hypothetical protein